MTATVAGLAARVAELERQLAALHAALAAVGQETGEPNVPPQPARPPVLRLARTGR